MGKVEFTNAAAILGALNPYSFEDNIRGSEICAMTNQIERSDSYAQAAEAIITRAGITPLEVATMIRNSVGEFSDKDQDLNLHHASLKVVVAAYQDAARDVLANAASDHPDTRTGKTMRFLIDCDDRLVIAASVMEMKLDSSLGRRMCEIAYDESDESTAETAYSQSFTAANRQPL